MTSSAQAIRDRLQDSREDFARSLGITLDRLQAIEAGDPLTQSLVMKLMQLAKDRGLALSLDHVYGIKPLP